VSIAADVYGVAPHVGRGGWSWYTGSAGWMYRLIVESLLGLSREGDRLRIAPCLPRDWEGFTVGYRHGATTYVIDVTRAAGQSPTLTLDGVEQSDICVALVDDQMEHHVVVRTPTTS